MSELVTKHPFELVMKLLSTLPPGPFPDDLDMHDSDEDMTRWSLLRDRLEVRKKVIQPHFHMADESALTHQRYHRLLTKLAALCGTGAVLFAILQLAYSDLSSSHVMAVAEVVAVIAAFTAVVLGVISGRQGRWLLERHKSERLRLLKFRFLIDPATWSNAAAHVDQQVADVRAEVVAIQSVTSLQFREWTERDEGAPRAPVAARIAVGRDARPTI